MRQETGGKRQGHFLQSKEWEEFQRSLGREVFRVEGQLIVKLPLAFGKSYLYSGGTFDGQNTQKFFAYFARKENAVFLKFEPMTEDMILGKELTRAGFIKSKKEIQPQRTIVLDLTKSEEELLSKMHPKTRYNIKVAEKHGIRVMKHITYNMKHAEEFLRLLEKTSARDNFSSHPKEYYKKLLDLPIAQLFVAEYQNKIIAANIVIFYERCATYLHGGSDYEYRNLMAPYLLHWETIKYAKEHGIKEYDFWGIDEKKWPGVTKFKRGFGGKEVVYVGSYDYVFSNFWYGLYRLHQYARVKLF